MNKTWRYYIQKQYADQVIYHSTSSGCGSEPRASNIAVNSVAEILPSPLASKRWKTFLTSVWSMESTPKEETEEAEEEDLELIDRLLLDLEEPPFWFDIVPSLLEQLRSWRQLEILLM
jgi:hypothetical protein